MPHLRRRLLLGSVLVVTSGLLLSAGVVRMRADAAWQSMRASSDELRSQLAARRWVRPVLWGEAIEGRAFDHYVAGGERADALKFLSTSEVVKLLRGSDGELAVSPRRRDWQTPLVQLHAGAHAAGPAPRDDDDTIYNLLQLRALAYAATLETAALRADGDALAAVRVTFDALTMGADLVREGLLIHQMMGCAILEIPMQRWDDQALRSLDAEARSELARGLEQLDALLPRTLDCDREGAYMAHLLLNIPANAEADWAGSPGLSYGFSSRWMVADAFGMFVDMAAELRSLSDAPWADRERAWQRHVDRMIASGNAAAGVMCPNFIAAEQGVRGTLTTLRLLRTALLMLADPDATPLDDPFGNGPLQLAHDDEGITIRSVGKRGDKALERRVGR
ncbi:MAG: hypothetical protein R3F29_01710 [Planctomycetota bacterium]